MILNQFLRAGAWAHACRPSYLEAEAGGSSERRLLQPRASLGHVKRPFKTLMCVTVEVPYAHCPSMIVVF